MEHVSLEVLPTESAWAILLKNRVSHSAQLMGDYGTSEALRSLRSHLCTSRKQAAVMVAACSQHAHVPALSPTVAFALSRLLVPPSTSSGLQGVSDTDRGAEYILFHLRDALLLRPGSTSTTGTGAPPLASQQQEIMVGTSRSPLSARRRQFGALRILQHWFINCWPENTSGTSTTTAISTDKQIDDEINGSTKEKLAEAIAGFMLRECGEGLDSQLEADESSGPSQNPTRLLIERNNLLLLLIFRLASLVLAQHKCSTTTVGAGGKEKIQVVEDSHLQRLLLDSVGYLTNAVKRFRRWHCVKSSDDTDSNPPSSPSEGEGGPRLLLGQVLDALSETVLRAVRIEYEEAVAGSIAMASQGVVGSGSSSGNTGGNTPEDTVRSLALRLASILTPFSGAMESGGSALVVPPTQTGTPLGTLRLRTLNAQLRGAFADVGRRRAAAAQPAPEMMAEQEYTLSTFGLLGTIFNTAIHLGVALATSGAETVLQHQQQRYSLDLAKAICGREPTLDKALGELQAFYGLLVSGVCSCLSDLSTCAFEESKQPTTAKRTIVRVGDACSGHLRTDESSRRCGLAGWLLLASAQRCTAYLAPSLGLELNIASVDRQQGSGDAGQAFNQLLSFYRRLSSDEGSKGSAGVTGMYCVRCCSSNPLAGRPPKGMHCKDSLRLLLAYHLRTQPHRFMPVTFDHWRNPSSIRQSAATPPPDSLISLLFEVLLPYTSQSTDTAEDEALMRRRKDTALPVHSPAVQRFEEEVIRLLVEGTPQEGAADSWSLLMRALLLPPNTAGSSTRPSKTSTGTGTCACGCPQPLGLLVQYRRLIPCLITLLQGCELPEPTSTSSPSPSAIERIQFLTEALAYRLMADEGPCRKPEEEEEEGERRRSDGGSDDHECPLTLFIAVVAPSGAPGSESAIEGSSTAQPIPLTPGALATQFAPPSPPRERGRGEQGVSTATTTSTVVFQAVLKVAAEYFDSERSREVCKGTVTNVLWKLFLFASEKPCSPFALESWKGLTSAFYCRQDDTRESPSGWVLLDRIVRRIEAQIYIAAADDNVPQKSSTVEQQQSQPSEEEVEAEEAEQQARNILYRCVVGPLLLLRALPTSAFWASRRTSATSSSRSLSSAELVCEVDQRLFALLFPSCQQEEEGPRHSPQGWRRGLYVDRLNHPHVRQLLVETITSQLPLEVVYQHLLTAVQHLRAKHRDASQHIHVPVGEGKDSLHITDEVNELQFRLLCFTYCIATNRLAHQVMGDVLTKGHQTEEEGNQKPKGDHAASSSMTASLAAQCACFQQIVDTSHQSTCTGTDEGNDAEPFGYASTLYHLSISSDFPPRALVAKDRRRPGAECEEQEGPNVKKLRSLVDFLSVSLLLDLSAMVWRQGEKRGATETEGGCGAFKLIAGSLSARAGDLSAQRSTGSMGMVIFASQVLHSLLHMVRQTVHAQVTANNNHEEGAMMAALMYSVVTQGLVRTGLVSQATHRALEHLHTSGEGTTDHVQDQVKVAASLCSVLFNFLSLAARPPPTRGQGGQTQALPLTPSLVQDLWNLGTVCCASTTEGLMKSPGSAGGETGEGKSETVLSSKMMTQQERETLQLEGLKLIVQLIATPQIQLEDSLEPAAMAAALMMVEHIASGGSGGTTSEKAQQLAVQVLALLSK